MRRLAVALLLSGLAGPAIAGADPGGPDAPGFGAGDRGGTRVKDITTIRGVRDNQLFGYGLVIGLAGSGDTLRNSPFTEQALEAMLDHVGINVREEQLRTRNVAAVMVTGHLPPFAGLGSRIDVDVSSIGDAGSLRGGTLLLTEMRGADGEVYAVAQGPVSVSGFSAEGEASTLMQGVATSGRIANGALVERMLPGGFGGEGPIVLELRNPDFATAVAVADRINRYTSQRYGRATAREDSLRTVTLLRPESVSAARFMAEVGQLRVRPDVPARVVIDESSGTVVIGSNVQINPVAVTHGTLTVRITEFPQVSQPEPFARRGQTELVPRTDIQAVEREAYLAVVGGADLQMLVRGLNEIGLKPTGIIAILQAIETAGALQAELVVQ